MFIIQNEFLGEVEAQNLCKFCYMYFTNTDFGILLEAIEFYPNATSELEPDTHNYRASNTYISIKGKGTGSSEGIPRYYNIRKSGYVYQHECTDYESKTVL